MMPYPQQMYPAPPPKKGMSGCVIALLIVGSGDHAERLVERQPATFGEADDLSPQSHARHSRINRAAELGHLHEVFELPEFHDS